jgi:predicted membrane protein
MQYFVEIILFLLFIYLASTENLQLSYLSSTYLGKVLLICSTIFLASFNLIYGVLAVVIYIVLTHKNLEFMEGMSPTEDKKEEKDEKEKMTVQDNRDPKEKCDPNDPNCKITSGHEQLTTDEKLRPTDSNTLPAPK